MRASKIMQQRALNNSKISFLWNSTVEEIIGEEKVEGVTLNNTLTGEKSSLNISGLFIAIGHRPNTDLFIDQLTMDESGYLLTGADRSTTNIEGVFACGDVQDQRYRQAITAAGSGCMAALDAERWLENFHDK